MAKNKNQQSQVDFDLLVKAILLVSKKIEVLTQEVRILKKELIEGPNKEGNN